MTQHTDHVPDIRKKVTAVEWFFDNLKNHEIQAEHFELYQQAKAMEKEQIMLTWYDCKLSIIDKKPMDAEEYYNQVYNAQNNV